MPNLPAGVMAIAAGSYHSFAIAASTSEVHAWGLNSYGQLGMPFDTAVQSSEQFSYFPKRVAQLCGRGVVAGDCGENHTVMLTAGGKVLTFGRCAYGRLGLASVDPKDDEPHATPSEVEGLVGRAVAVAAGSSGNTAAGAYTRSLFSST